MSQIHVIIGEDDYLLSEAAKKFAGDGTGLETIDSLNSTNAELQLRDLRAADASLMTPPFLEPRKTTWWKNVGFLPQSGRGAPAQDVKEALEKFAKKLAASSLPENQTFILSGPRLLASSIFAKTLKGAVELIVFSAGKPWEQARNAAARVTEDARALGLRFEPRGAELFVSRVGTDTRSLKGELAKLRDYLGPKRHTITAEDIAAVTSQGVGVEPESWAITDALGERSLAKTLEATRRFEGESGFAILVTTVVERFLRQLAELKDAEARGRLDEATAGMNPYAVRKNTAFLANWTLPELRRARRRFFDLRERAVSSSGSIDELAVIALVQICRGRRAR